MFNANYCVYETLFPGLITLFLELINAIFMHIPERKTETDKQNLIF